MAALAKSKRIYLDLVVSWLRSEIAKLSHILSSIEQSYDYHDEFIVESIKTTESELRRIRKYIEAN